MLQQRKGKGPRNPLKRGGRHQNLAARRVHLLATLVLVSIPVRRITAAAAV